MLKQRKALDKKYHHLQNSVLKAVLISNNYQPDKSTNTDKSINTDISTRQGFRINNSENSPYLTGYSASLSQSKEFLNAIKPNLFTHYIDLKKEKMLQQY